MSNAASLKDTSRDGSPPISGEHLVVRRETGKEEAVRVHCDEGVANHVGPEPCAGNREGVGEAERVNDFETAFCLV